MKIRTIYRILGMMTVLICLGCTAKQSVKAHFQPPTVYYVSPAGSDSNSGSSSSPFKTIQKAADIVNPGDTVVVKNGTYVDHDGDRRIVKLGRGGTSSAWVTFRAENKWGAVLDGQRNRAEYCWISARANYIRIENFEMKECGKAYLANLKEHDVVIKGNYIHNTSRVTVHDLWGREAVFTGIGTYGFTFDSNIFHSIGRLNPYTDPPAPESSCTTPSDYVFNGTPYPNLLACYNHDHALYLHGQNNTVINNVFYDLKSGWGVMSGYEGNAIVNNTFFGDNPATAPHAIGQILVKRSGTTIHNNIFYGDGDCGILTYRESAGGTIKNNLFYPNIDIQCNTPSYPPRGTWSISDNILNQDPKFVNAAGGDFHLQAGSPAIRNCNAETAPKLDHDRKPRSKDGHCDIGAYEH